MKRKNKKPKPKKNKNTPRIRSAGSRKPLSADALRQDLSDPERAQIFMDQLADFMTSEPALQSLRFPAGPLLDALDELAESSADDLAALEDPLQQRMTILNHVLPRFLTRKFAKTVERTLLNLLENNKKSLRHFRALGAGLFFLEFHMQENANPGANPLWNLIFDISYDDALATAGGGVTPAEPLDPERSATASPIPDTLDEHELSESNTELARKALQLIDTGKVELGFALDTVLLGLREITGTSQRTAEDQARALKATFEQEIGVNQWNDLIWGLEYAVDELEGDRKQNFETVLKAAQMLAPRDNPIVFAIYYKSVTEFYRFLKPGEKPYAEAIVQDPSSVNPMIQLGAFLMRNNVPNRALNAFTAAIRLDPSHELARMGAGVACWDTESFREARMHFGRAARLWSGYLADDHPHRQMADALAELDNFEELPQNAYDLVLSNTLDVEEEK